ncbi:MAG: AEC family transporter [Oscillibacter sp.]|nr:AEC family transporter [Oscillibacter sp.]
MISKILQLECIMVLLGAIGFFLRRRNVITAEGQNCITDLLLDVILPCNIFLSFETDVDRETLHSFAVTVAISVIVMVLVAALGKWLYRRQEESRQKVFRYGLVNSNALFLGLPIIQSLLGADGVLQLTMYMIFVRMFCWSYGLSLYTGIKADRRATAKRLLTNPCMVAAELGVVAMLTGFRLPAMLEQTADYCNRCLMALSMLLIGAVLTDLKPGRFFHGDVWGFTLLRLVLIPGAVYLGCRLFQVPQVVAATCTLLSGMPAASMTAVLAARYDGDAELGSLLVAGSTLLSAVTIPLWYLLF